VLDLLIVAYARFVAMVKVQQSLYWPVADQREVSRRVRLPDFHTVGT
jgi:hypothetical protein